MAERFNRTMHERAMASLHEKKASRALWAEAHDKACHDYNISPVRAFRRITPHEAFGLGKPDLSHLRIFGSKCYVHVHDEQRRKLDPKSVAGIFVGYSDTQKAYRVYLPNARKVVVSRDVVVFEDTTPHEMDLDLPEPLPVRSEGVSGRSPSTGGTQRGGGNGVFTAGGTATGSGHQAPTRAPSPTPESTATAPPSSTSPRPFAQPATHKRTPAPAPVPTLATTRSARVSRPSWKATQSREYQAAEAQRKAETKAARDTRKQRRAIKFEQDEPSPDMPATQDSATALDTAATALDDDDSPETRELALLALLDEPEPSPLPDDMLRALADVFGASSGPANAFATYDTLAHAYAASESAPRVPRSYKDASTGPDAPTWREAMLDEERNFLDKGSFRVEKIPCDYAQEDVLGGTWVYAVKTGPSGEFTRAKARYCIRGDHQTYGVNYWDVYAPTAHPEVIRIIGHLGASQGWHFGQMDVRAAFLNGTLDETVYIRKPPGFSVHVPPGHALRVLKSIYGLKQAAHVWNKEMDEKLTSELEYFSLSSDVAVYVRVTPLDDGTSHVVVIAVHVDNMFIATNTAAELERVRRELHGLFEMTDEDETWLLGMHLVRDLDARTIAFSHAPYIDALLERFNMSECRPVEVPLPMGTRLSVNDCASTPEDKDEMAKRPYRALVGSLMWLATMSRPDIAYAVIHLAQFNANPGRAHWNAALRVLRYLKGTRDYALVLGGAGGTRSEFVGYSDSSWGNDWDDGRSVAGYVFQLDGATISWRSGKQPTVALSSAEAEYMALTNSSKQGLFLHAILDELGVIFTRPTTIYSDNNAAISLVHNRKQNHGRTKHINIRHHFIREHVEAGTFRVTHISTKSMVADTLTKALGKDMFEWCREAMGVRRI
jgi:hypothetical protein